MLTSLAAAAALVFALAAVARAASVPTFDPVPNAVRSRSIDR